MWPISRKPDREWADAVKSCLQVKPEFYPAIDPVAHIPSDRFRELAARFDSLVLASLVETGDAIERDVPIHMIVGVGASRGRPKFDLGRLPETIQLYNHYETGRESFGPLDARQMSRLWESIVSGSGAFDDDGRIRLKWQTWDDCYIVRNSGTSRRLALWLRLQSYVDLEGPSGSRVVSLPARVDPLLLGKDALTFLQREGAILFARHSGSLCQAVRRLGELDDRFRYDEPCRLGSAYGADDDRVMAMLTVPKPDCAAPRRLEGMIELQQWCVPMFDLGRYLAERSSTYRLDEKTPPL